MPTGLCAPGFYCPGSAYIDTRTPSTYPNNFTCPAGYYCPEGSDSPVACPAGQFTQIPGQFECDLCPAGFYCVGDRTNVEPIDCPPGHYCPSGTFEPFRCPNGTFTYENETNLEIDDECRPCPAGQYCRHGFVSGECSAGYYCLAGSEDYTPDDYDSDDLTALACVPNTHCAGACPAGNYCPEGVEMPIACPEHTLREIPGARALNDCLPCPAGYWCRSGDPVPEPCPAGQYCEEGVGPIDCPVLTYRDVMGGANLTDCFPCVAGFYCNITGIADYSVYPCPVGNYCPEVSEPLWCPAGSMRPTPGAAEYTDCWDCREG